MITGKIEQSRYPHVLLDIVTSEQKEKFDFLVDTGFDDEISLSYHYADLFDLELVQSIKATYANGESIDEILALTKIIWFGEEREVRVILSNDEKPAIGTLLLQDCLLIIDFVSGILTIEKR